MPNLGVDGQEVVALGEEGRRQEKGGCRRGKGAFHLYEDGGTCVI